MKELIALIPWIVFVAWFVIKEPKGGIILVGFTIAFFCFVGLAEILKLVNPYPKETGEKNGDP